MLLSQIAPAYPSLAPCAQVHSLLLCPYYQGLLLSTLTSPSLCFMESVAGAIVARSLVAELALQSSGHAGTGRTLVPWCGAGTGRGLPGTGCYPLAPGARWPSQGLWEVWVLKSKGITQFCFWWCGEKWAQLTLWVCPSPFWALSFCFLTSSPTGI